MFERVLHRYWARPDTEHEQAVLRILVGMAFVGYAIFLVWSDAELANLPWNPGLWAAPVAVLSGFAFLAHIHFFPKSSPRRRMVGIVVDATLASVAMHYMDPYGYPYFIVYPWIIVGNGFRYGPHYAVVATAASLAAFSITVLVTPYYWEIWEFVVLGFLLLTVFPFYTYLLLRRLQSLYDESHAYLERTMNMEDTQRLALANELHDGLGQQLTALRGYHHLILNLAQSERGDPDRAQHHLEEIRSFASAAISLVQEMDAVIRSRLRQLVPDGIDEEPLIEVMRVLIGEYKVPHAHVTITERFVNVPSWRFNHGIAPYRILQEALTNAIRHSEAHTISVEIQTDLTSDYSNQDAQLVLRIRDDGRGFDVGEARKRGMGLAGMYERTRTVGGAIDIVSSKGQGTLIEVLIPILRLEPVVDQCALSPADSN